MAKELTNFPRETTLREILDAIKQGNIYAAASISDIKISAPALVPALIGEHGAKQAFTIFCKTALACSSTMTLNEIVTLFYENAVAGKVYGSEFYNFSVSQSSIGTKTDSNANMVCEPSTNTTAGQDDYADLALFMPININYNWSDTTNLEPTITEIEGVTEGFSLSSPNGLVGVLQMGAWAHIYNDGQKKIRKYSDHQATPDYEPLPECVRAKDNSFRPWMIHAKYVAGKDANGKLTSASGLIPAASCASSKTNAAISHDGQIALWRQLGAAYSGESMCDRAFLELMFEIKYARLGNSGLIEGCTGYNTMKKVAYAEEDTTRVLLATADGSYYWLGSTVSLGTGTDRSTAAGHDVVDHAIIKQISSVEVDGTTYTALYLDVDTPFTTTTDLNVIAEPWVSGSCDAVRGNDGSPYSLTDGKNPAMIQGIEFMVGGYEVLADTALYSENGEYTVKLNRLAANLATGGAGTGSYDLAEKIPMYATAGWNYIRECGNTIESLLVPIATGSGASSSNGYRAAAYTQNSETTNWREWRASCSLLNGGSAGVPAVHCDGALTNAAWNILARASGSGGNRGEWGAA